MIGTILVWVIYIIMILMLLSLIIMTVFEFIGYQDMKKNSMIKKELLKSAVWINFWRKIYKFVIIEFALLVILWLTSIA